MSLSAVPPPGALSRLSAELRVGAQTSRQAVQRSLDIAHEAEPRINAFTALFDAQALAAADRCDARRERGEPLGPLHGVPFAVKDLIHVAGELNTRGSRLHANVRATVDAPMVERMRAAGAVLIGKTTTTEFGWKASSHGPLHGITRNPHDLRLTTGGSSCGSAAAVAAGAVTLALGSDGGGSVRIPAAFCGVFTLKGSLGRVPTWPWSATEMLSHGGPITAGAHDSALAFDVLSGPHWRDPQSLPREPVPYAQRVMQALPASLRVAFAPTLFDASVDPEIDAVLRAAVARLEQGLRLPVAALRPTWSDPFDAFEALWTIGRGAVYGDTAAADIPQLDPGFACLVEAARRSSPRDYMHALQARADFSQQVARSFEDIDLLLLPVTPVLPFAAEADGPPGWDGTSSPVAWGRWTPFTYPFNLTGQPAAALPCGHTRAGLPVGLQVVGRRHDDATVLQFCCHAERVLAARD